MFWFFFKLFSKMFVMYNMNTKSLSMGVKIIQERPTFNVLYIFWLVTLHVQNTWKQSITLKNRSCFLYNSITSLWMRNKFTLLKDICKLTKIYFHICMYHVIGCFEEILYSISKQKCNQRKFRHPYISISVNVLPYLLMNHFLFSKQI